MEIITKSPTETKTAGQKLSASLKPGDIVALSGGLGAGKTTFVQGVAAGLNANARITSPTFIIMRDYDDFHHVDLYRLEENVEQEVENLGLIDIIKEGKSIVIIEWAEKIESLLPGNTIWVNIENTSESERKIEIK